MKFIDDFKYMIKDLVNPETHIDPLEIECIEISLIAEFNSNIPESKIQEIAADIKSIFDTITNFHHPDIKSKLSDLPDFALRYKVSDNQYVGFQRGANQSIFYLPTIQKRYLNNSKQDKSWNWVIEVKPYNRIKKNTFEPIKFSLEKYPSEAMTFYPISEEICNKYDLERLPPHFRPIFIDDKPAIEDTNYPPLFKVKYLVEDRIKYEISKKQKYNREDDFDNIGEDIDNSINKANIPCWGNNCFLGKDISERIKLVKKFRDKLPNSVEWLKQVEELLKKYNL